MSKMHIAEHAFLVLIFVPFRTLLNELATLFNKIRPQSTWVLGGDDAAATDQFMAAARHQPQTCQLILATPEFFNQNTILKQFIMKAAEVRI